MSGKGCYVCGFTVHEAKDLVKDGNAVDPLVVVRCLGREYKTDMKRNKLAHAKFEESFIWNDLTLTEDEYSSAMVEFELQGACVFTRNDNLGTGKVQLSMVRRRPNHTYVKKWLQLSHDSQLMAKLMVTVFSYGEGDDPPRPEDLENDGEETAAQLADLNAAVLNGDSVARQFNTGYHLFVQVHRAEHLGGGSKTYNPYISMEFGGHTLSTPNASDTHTMASDECFRVPVTMPVFSDSIVIRVWDKKSWSADELIVQGRLSFSLIRTHALAPKWFNFYGFAQEEVADMSQILDMGEKLEPNSYQGRILVSARCHKVMKENDLLKPQIIKGNIQEEPASLPCTLLVDVFEISGCPGKEVFVHVGYGKTSKKTKTAKRSPDCISQETMTPGIFRLKDDKGRIAPMQVVVPADPTQQLDVILSIYANLEDFCQGMLAGKKDSWQRVGFSRIKLKNVSEWKGEASAPRWAACKAMAHMPSSVEPGAILLSLYRSSKNMVNRQPCDVRTQNFELRAYVCMARGLKTVRGGQPNPYVQVTCAGESEKTAVVNVNTNPFFSQCLQLQIRLQVSERDMKAYPEPIQVVVYDECGDELSLMDKMENAANSAQAIDKKGEQKDQTEAAMLMGGVAIGAASDMFGLMTGDIMAKKRMGEVQQGRRAIGRANIIYRRISNPGKARVGKPKWIKLSGGQLGSAHTGDLLIGFELLKRKNSLQLPVRELKPPLKKCSLFMSILGLRNIDPPDGSDLKSPTLFFQVPVIGGSNGDLWLPYKKKPDLPLSTDDSNKKWTLRSKQGFEFIEVVHMEVMLPEEPLWEPFVKIVLLDDKEFIGEGRISLAYYMNWVPAFVATNAISSKDGYSDSDVDSADEFEGVQVSEDPEDREDKDSGVQYIPVRIENEPTGVTFNEKDQMGFPPKVQAVSEKSIAAKLGVRAGDWLIGLHLPSEKIERPTATWKGQETAQFMKQCDQNRVRPLMMRFRKVLKNEVTVIVRQGPLGLHFAPGSGRPAKFQRDGSKGNIFSRAAVDPGWSLAAVNGTDTMGMSAVDQKLQTLLGRRPCVLTFRAPVGININAVIDERKITQGKPVQLNGMPWALMQATDAKLGQKLQAIWQTRVPKPLAILPTTADVKRLNLHPARGGCLDVRGVIRAGLHCNAGGLEDDMDDDMSRPSVPGRLEEYLPSPWFESVPLNKGGIHIGFIKMRIQVVHPFNPSWAERLPPKDLDYKLFNTNRLRTWIKSENPVVFRVRTYVIRGLNVSGSTSGYGSPYLFFVYGQTPVNLKGHRFENETNPRFFRTEERDVKFPEQNIFEIGLNDYKGDTGGEDELIGRSLIDLEDRWFSPYYKDMMRMNRVPIEYRPMESAEKGSLCKGSLEIWLELMDASQAAEVPLAPLNPPTPTDVEIRVVIWSVKNVHLLLCYDENTGEQREAIDLFVRCTLDSKAFNGSQPKDQQSDVHHGSTGEGEFNWRFVWSKVATQKGVPLDCFMQISIWEHFTLARPMMLCEGLLEMRNYCKKVALSGESISMAADLPLDNPKLWAMMENREGQTGLYVKDESSGDEDSGESSEDEGKGQAMNAEAQEDDSGPKAAGVVKILVEVFPQQEASMPDMKVGLARNEPNRLPTLLYPKTGRSWKTVLPTALAAVEAAVEAYNGGTKKMRLLAVALVVMIILYGLLVYKMGNGCTVLQKHCVDECPCCQRCKGADVAADSAKFCYWAALSGYPDKCATDSKHKVSCNCMIGQTDCTQPEDTTSGCARPIGATTAAKPAAATGGRRLLNMSDSNTMPGEHWRASDEAFTPWTEFYSR